MPPSKKATVPSSKPSTRDRRSSSRHSTPTSALTERSEPPTPTQPVPDTPRETPYLHTPTAVLLSAAPSIDAVIARHTPAAVAKHDAPAASALHALHDAVQSAVLSTSVKRGETCSGAIRLLALKRKERLRATLEAEAESRERKRDEAARVKLEGDEEEVAVPRRGKKGGKRGVDEMEGEAEEEEAALRRRSIGVAATGAHGVARQDGVGVNEGAPPPPSPPVQQGTAAIDPMDTATATSTPASETSHHQLAPIYEAAFGKDPSTFSDPTIYDIRPATSDMTPAELKALYNVAQFPSTDLHDLTAGTPPDQDFSNAKPANQINFSTFQTYLEPYIRPLTEEDVAFLKERGDRLTPYVMPKRGDKHYRELWAAEDGLPYDNPRMMELPPNEARKSMEHMTDDLAETDEISLGPVMARLMSLTRAAPSPTTADHNNTADGTANGDTAMANGVDDTIPEPVTATTSPDNHPPATRLPDHAPRVPDLPAPDYDTLEMRALQELRYLGLLTPTDTPCHAQAADTETAARLRLLQAELARVRRLNGARRARVLELAGEALAMQEYATIAEDLDGQVSTAYLKRNRSLARPGGAGRKGGVVRGGKGTVVGVRGVSDGVRLLMQKRRDWIEMVGPVVQGGRAGVVEGTVFGEAVMKRLERGEREAEAADEGAE